MWDLRSKFNVIIRLKTWTKGIVLTSLLTLMSLDFFVHLPNTQIHRLFKKKCTVRKYFYLFLKLLQLWEYGSVFGELIDHFARCKQHWSRSTSCFLTLHKSWDKIQPTEHIKLNQRVKQTSLRCFPYMWNKENKLKQEVFLDQCCLRLAKWSIM